MRPFFTIIIFFLLTGLISAQITWQQTNGPYGGQYYDLVISKDGTFYLGTGNGLYKSTDNGANWNKDITINVNSYVGFLSINSKNETIAITDTSIFIYKNNNWIKHDDGISNTVYTSLLVDINDNIFVGTTNGIYKSTNNGINWTRIFTFDNANIYKVNCIAIDSNNNIFAGTNYGIYKSNNEGTSWQNVTPDSTIKWINDIIVYRNEIFFSTYKGVYNSTNFGNSWKLNNLSNFNDGLFNFDIGKNNILIGCSLNGVYNSSDGGNMWIKLPINIKTSFNLGYRTLKVGNDGLYYLLAYFGIIKFDKDFTDWHYIEKGITNSDVSILKLDYFGNLIAGTRFGVYSSSNKGNTWRLLFDGRQTSYVTDIAINTKGFIFIGTAGNGIYRTIDNGANWDEVTTGTYRSFINGIVVNKNNDIYAATYAGLLKSTNDGNNWEKLNIDLGYGEPLVESVTIDLKGNIYAGLYGQSIIKSTDNGGSWVKVDNGIENKTIAKLAVNSKGYIFAGTNYGDGIFRSTDNGSSWLPINNGLGNIYYITSLYISPNDEIFFTSSYNDGGYKSTDDGNSWLKIFPDNQIKLVTCFLSDYEGNIFVGTSGNGIYKSYQPEVKPAFVDYKIQNFPNPFNNTTTIQYEIPSYTKVSIILYDILGKEVKTLYEGERPRGRYFAIIDGSNLASGVYLVRLVTNNYSKTIKTILLK